MFRPDPPANVAATESGSTVVITWDAVDDAVLYSVFRSTQFGKRGNFIGKTALLTWIDVPPYENKVYWYGLTVRVTGAGCSGLSNQAPGMTTIPVPVEIPDVPTGVTVELAPVEGPDVPTGLEVELA